MKEFFFTILLEDNVLSYIHSNLKAPVKVKNFDTNSLQFKTISLLASLARNKQLSKNQLEVLGEQLYSVLLQEKIFDKLITAVKLNAAEGSLIRIELLFKGDDRGYLEWPWEYIYRPDLEGEDDINMFLTENPKYLIVRHLFKENVRSSLIEGNEIRFLFVASGPTLKSKNKKIKLPPIIYEGINKVINETVQLKNNESAFKIKLTELIDLPAQRCTIENFTEKLSEKPHIIHILAHGRFNETLMEGEILFMKEDGSEEWISGKTLNTLMSDCNDLKLVFLESCETGVLTRLNPISGVAQQLSDINVPSVIAMQSEIVQTDAHLFSEIFYKRLFEGKSVYGAMKEAIIKIRNTNIKDKTKNSFGVPVLYARDEGILFKLPESKNIQQQASSSAGGGNTSLSVEENKQMSPEEKRKKIEDLQKELATLTAQMPQLTETGLIQETKKEGKNPIQTKIDATKI